MRPAAVAVRAARRRWEIRPLTGQAARLLFFFAGRAIPLFISLLRILPVSSFGADRRSVFSLLMGHPRKGNPAGRQLFPKPGTKSAGPLLNPQWSCESSVELRAS